MAAMETVKEKLQHLLTQAASSPSSVANIPDCVVIKTEPADDSICAPESSSRNDSAPFSSASVDGNTPVCETASQGKSGADAGSIKPERTDSMQGQVVMKGEDFWVEVDPNYESEDEPEVTFEVKIEPESERSQLKEQKIPAASEEARALPDGQGQSSRPPQVWLPSSGGAASVQRLVLGVPVLKVCKSAIPALSLCPPTAVPGDSAVKTLPAPVLLCPQPAGVNQPGGTCTSGSSMRNVAVLDPSGHLQGVVPVNAGVMGQHLNPNENLAIIPRGDGTFNCFVIYGDKNPFIPEYDSTRKMDKNYVCCECGQKFKQDNHLREHGMTVHGSSKVYCCLECGKKFGYRDTLKTHIATMHRGEGKFPCSACKKQFDREGHLLTHFATVHRGEKKFMCTECGKGFGLKSTLMTHITSVHKQEKHFTCPECGKKFSQRCHLKVHYAGVHKGAAKFSCSECSRTFAFESYLKKHVAVVHKGEKNFLCSQCGKTFGEKGSLDNHIQSMHKRSRYSCPDCNKDFRHKSWLKKHTDRAHGDSG